MENTLQIINRQNVLDKDFTVYGSVENPLFLAKDVAEWIDYAKTSKGAYNVSMMLSSIDEDEKLVSTILVSGQNRECSFVTENGLYEILMLSRKPIAKQFKKEVKKILHELRNNGGYIVGQENLSDEQLMAKALLVAQNVIAKKDAAIEVMKPKADVYDQLVDRSKCINFRDMAAKIGLSQNEFMTILKSKYIYKNSIGEYRAYSEYQKYFTLRTFNKNVDSTGEQLMLNMDGITYFCNKYKKSANNLIKTAINNCPDCNNTFIDRINDYCFYTLDEVAKEVKEPKEVIKNYLKLQHYIDSEGLLTTDAINSGYFLNSYPIKISKTYKDKIVKLYSDIREATKNLKKSEFGKAE